MKSSSQTPEIPPLSAQHPQHNAHQAFVALQNHCSCLLQSFLNSPFRTNLQSTLSNLSHHAKFVFSSPLTANPAWARMPQRNETLLEKSKQSVSPLSVEEIEERLAGVAVYGLCNESEEFVTISGSENGKYLGILCFKEEDAEALLGKLQVMNPGMRRGAKVVPLALSKAFQLKVHGVAFRMIPESTQIKNALKTRQRTGILDRGFLGVPVFQSRSLILESEGKTYRPFFFRKEDLEDSLLRASRVQTQLNPAFRQGDIQVAVLEDMLKEMKDGSRSTWGDVVFVPPGLDVSVDPSKLNG